MFDGRSLIMLPSPVDPTSSSNSTFKSASRRPNTPQEDDENMSQLPDPASSPGFHRRHDDDDDDPKHHGQHPAHFPRAHGYAPHHHHQLHHHHHHLLHHPHPPTPFPSRAPDGSWGPGLHLSFPSSGGGGGGSWTGSGYPSCPANSCLTAKDGSPATSQSAESASYSGDKFPSLAGPYSASLGSLEQPFSLHSSHPSPELHHHTMPPYYCLPPGPSCCAQCPPEAFKMGPTATGHLMPMLGPHLPYGPFYQNDSRVLGVGGMYNPNNLAKHKDPSDSIQLSLEQRKVFVTYEADSDEHVNKVINFVALLRHNGFDTHIDMFEQQFRSISKIDFMERYLNEKEYLIIIIISPKYYETVTASPFSLTDERTYNTVYIHKQLQNEFIQNGSKNFRFIPIVFPGARKCHVPSWLQNTHVFSWPRDLDDILRRLMRVEKYNPPRIGQLPTIISMPI